MWLKTVSSVLLSCFKTRRDQQVRDRCITCSVSPAGSFSLSVGPTQTLVVSESLQTYIIARATVATLGSETKYC